MPQPNDLSRSLVALDQNSTIIAVIEMSQSTWLVAGMLPGIERQPRKKLEPSPERLLALLHRWQDEAVRAGRTITRIALAFEAGRDGFWLARWLEARGVEAHVIHASSVAVSREHRRAKTDRLDTELLKRGFLGWLRVSLGRSGALSSRLASRFSLAARPWWTSDPPFGVAPRRLGMNSIEEGVIASCSKFLLAVDWSGIRCDGAARADARHRQKYRRHSRTHRGDRVSTLGEAPTPSAESPFRTGTSKYSLLRRADFRSDLICDIEKLTRCSLR